MKNKYGKKLTKNIISNVFKTFIIYTICYVLLYYLGIMASKLIIWQPHDFLYKLLTTFRDNLVMIIIVWFIGAIIIFIIYLFKATSYIDKLVDASKNLANSDVKIINLPVELKDVEQKMNEIKETSLKNYNLAKENEQRKNDLIVYLAHDIKTPLTSMIGYLSLLDEIDDMPDNQRKKYVKTALEKSYKLEDLINELFDITRFNSEKIILEKEKLDLTIMLEQIVDDFYPLLKETNKKIEIQKDNNIMINADSDKLARVFNNVIKNAIFYSNSESKIIIRVIEEKTNVKIIIQNEGKKIPEEKLNRIFEKFYRADSARTTKTGNAGLGLAIAKEIVLLHKGTIRATSNDKHTKFYINLPLDS